jgi:cell division protein FtsW
MKHIRISIFMLVVALICIGVVMVYSSSAVFSYETYHSTSFFLKRHLLHLLIGIVLTAFVMSLDLQTVRRWIKPMFTASLLLLVLLFIPYFAREVGGARRWLKVGSFAFQPSELVKWTTVLFLADTLSGGQRGSAGLSGRCFFKTLIVLGITCGLILVQPDLGSAAAIGTVGMLLCFIAGVRFSYIGSLGILSLPVLYFCIFKVPYRRRRILAFLSPWSHAQGCGFQIVQSYLALGLGGLWGVGLGQSRQKLFYLPAGHTDFIFSIIGEELGLIGTVSVVILFVLFLWQGMKISLRSTDSFIQLLSFGIVISIVLAAAIHIAVVCGAVPTKGLPLPFISYGGSALIFNMMAVGLLLNSARKRYFQEQKIDSE